jgi:hypothetical protein
VGRRPDGIKPSPLYAFTSCAMRNELTEQLSRKEFTEQLSLLSICAKNSQNRRKLNLLHALPPHFP